jgi:hypothetical protein
MKIITWENRVVEYEKGATQAFSGLFRINSMIVVVRYEAITTQIRYGCHGWTI